MNKVSQHKANRLLQRSPQPDRTAYSAGGTGVGLRAATAAALVGLLLVASPSQAATYFWSAESGQLPPGPMYLAPESTGIPTIANGTMTISTTGVRNFQYYVQDFADLVMPSELSISWRVKLNENYSTIGVRSVAMVGFTVSPLEATAIGIGNGEVFWLLRSNARGGTAVVDTASFHDYELHVSTAAAGSTFTLSQDGTQILSGDVPFTSNPPLGSAVGPQIWFGDGTMYSDGSADWTYFGHNASALAVTAVPEPSSWLLMAGGLSWLLYRRRIS